MSASPFVITGIDPIRVRGDKFSQCDLMSPFVWPRLDGQFALLFRAVPADRRVTGEIWLAMGDGTTFDADESPLLSPGPGDLDIGGCEDPTFVKTDDGCLVYYTGLRRDGSAQLLYAAGPEIRSIAKRGVAHAATRSDHNTKEATVERLGERWILLFEYSRAGRSRVDRALGDGPAGPWREELDPFEARADKWDWWHLSTGPLLLDDPLAPLMFYNGADKEGNWAIGWVVLNADCSRVVARCDGPLIPAPGAGPDGRRIAFAASAVVRPSEIWLYFTENDRSMFRATLERR